MWFCRRKTVSSCASLRVKCRRRKKAAVGVRGIRMAEDDAVEHAYLLASRMDYTITYHDKEISLTAKIKLAKRDTKGTKIRV